MSQLRRTVTRRGIGSSRWWLFLIPALVFYVGFMAFPLLNSIRVSFYTGPGLTPDEFAGLDNYRALFLSGRTRDAFMNALGNTVVFFAIHMLVQNTLACCSPNCSRTGSAGAICSGPSSSCRPRCR